MWLRHDMHFYDSIIKCLVEAAKRQRQKREPLNDNDEGEKRYLFSFSWDWENSMSSTKEKQQQKRKMKNIWDAVFFRAARKKSVSSCAWVVQNVALALFPFDCSNSFRANK